LALCRCRVDIPVAAIVLDRHARLAATRSLRSGARLSPRAPLSASRLTRNPGSASWRRMFLRCGYISWSSWA
jgi:hypothetical protein